MPNTKELYKITHSSPEIKTVGDFLDDRNGVAHSYQKKPDAFLAISAVDSDGVRRTNRERIERSYCFPEEREYISAKANDLLLKVGTLLYVEYSEINSLSFVTEGIEVVSTDEPAFKAAQLAKLEGDEGYYQFNHTIRGQHLKGLSKEIFPEVTVWIWCRSLSPKDDESQELSGQMFDLTPFIINCKTNTAKNGGNFQLSLPPLVCELDKDRKWVINKSSIDRYENKKGTSLQGEGYVAQSSLFHAELLQENPNKASDEGLVRNQFLFHNIINSNDLIFIRFETLDMEKDQRYADSNEFYINKKNIAGRIYDMIGLVDTNTQTVNPESNDVSINITGRDLSKLFIEDGTYFYALENSQGLLKFAGQSEQKNSQISRIFGNGALNFISLYMFTSIEVIMKFIIQQLANIKIVPNGLFSSYGDRINYRFNETEGQLNNVPAVANKSEYKPKQTIEPANGIWKIIKLVIDESVANRRIQDSSFSTANGSLLNFIRKAVADPLAEFYMDTYGDMFHLIIRKPPTDRKAIVTLIEGKVNTEEGIPDTPPAIVTVRQEDVLQETLSFDDTQVYSWYHFFPQNNFFGDANTYALNYLGALYFEEYAQLYGSKPFQQPHPYMPFVPLNNSDEGLSLYETQAIQDLKYVVESSQYLPFSRKGTLVLNPDRRLKIGNLLRYESTGEIFMIDAVNQTYQITGDKVERTTTVNVSRGLVEQLIYGVTLLSKDETPKFVSYFNIINTDLVLDKLKSSTKKVTRQIKNNSTVSETPSIPETGIIEKGNTGIYYLESYNKFPENKKLFIRFINAINKAGYNVILIEGATNRSYAEQAALKRKNTNNAKPGTSRHEKASAIDATIVNKKTGKIYSKNTPKAEWIATGIPALAKSMGLEWADGDGSFGNYVDRVHFQISNSRETGELDTKDEFTETTEEIQTSIIDRDAVLSNFKVNQFVFNFFQKKLQFDPAYRTVTNRQILSNSGGELKEIIISGRKHKGDNVNH